MISSSIRYNCLNLPSYISYGSGCSTVYTYSATGEKLSVNYNVMYYGWSDQYCGNFIYRNGTLTRVLIDGGYITFSNSTPQYHFYLKDHLGNNRVVVNASKTVEEVNHYYPYGGLFGENAGSDVQPYKYNFSIERGKSKLAYSSEREKNRPKVNGKELDRMNGLDWYDYGARWMDAALGRFTTMDPLCEKYYGVSPYAYCLANPTKYVDINGNRPGDFFETMDLAALDFGLIYNNNSIIKNREYSSSIFVIYKDGQMGYTYTVPLKGNMGNSYASLPPLGISAVAWIHTHGAAVDENNKLHNYNRFTGHEYGITAEDLRKETNVTKDNADIAISNKHNLIAYLASPNGSLQKYNPNTGEISTISTDLPSDPRDTDRLNKNDPVKNKYNYLNYRLYYSLDILFKSLESLSHSNYNKQ